MVLFSVMVMALVVWVMMVTRRMVVLAYLGIRKSALMGCMSQRGGCASAISMAVMPRLHRSDLAGVGVPSVFLFVVMAVVFEVIVTV